MSDFSRGAAIVRKKHRKKNMRRLVQAYLMRFLCVLTVALVIGGCVWLINRKTEPVVSTPKAASVKMPDFVQDAALEVNPCTRPGNEVASVRSIVLHAADRIGLNAGDLRAEYVELSNKGTERGGSNFIVGYDGKVLMCVPPGEMTYGSDSEDLYAISITYCPATEDGSMSEAATESVIKLCTWLCEQYGLDADQVIRHYDVSGKLCPEYYLKNSAPWNSFKEQLVQSLSDAGLVETEKG